MTPGQEAPWRLASASEEVLIAATRELHGLQASASLLEQEGARRRSTDMRWCESKRLRIRPTLHKTNKTAGFLPE